MSLKLRVVVTDAYGQDRSYTLPSPRNNLTLEQVRTAFQPLLENQYLKSTLDGVYYTMVKKAETIQTTTSTII